MTNDAPPLPLPHDLGDGLVLRSAGPEDAERLAGFNARVHADSPGEPDAAVGAWTRDLLLRPHPTFRPALFTIVEEAATGRIASSLNLIPQTWSYGGVAIGVGRIELVGTDPDFRRRGLVRRQMEIAHRWSADAGHLLQGITGIPWYYRQFGYEMALALGANRRVPSVDVPTLAEGDTEAYRLRPATAADVPFLIEADAHGRERSLIACVRDAALWRYELDGASRENTGATALAVIERAPTGDDPARAVGFLGHPTELWREALWVRACELTPGVSWLAVGPSLMRGLRAIGEGVVASGTVGAGSARLDRIVFDLGEDHPLYRALAGRTHDASPPYAWYVRVPDLPAFVRRVAPVLEARLAASAAAGHSGEIKLDFYREGLRLAFVDGRLTEVGPWPEADWRKADASFPPLTFLHLLVGHRSLAELEYAFADCRPRTEAARALVEILFPKRSSFIWPVD